MTIRLSVQADVIDIKNDLPQPEDTFLVDTNVWLWQTYPNATLNAKATRRSQKYSSYLSLALSAGTQLKYSGLTLAELAHVIEKQEYEIFKRRNNLPKLSAKAYRHNYPAERQSVAAIVQTAWVQVTSLAASVDLTIDKVLSNVALHRFQTQALDGYDLFLLEAISRAELSNIQVLTDDMDYACVPGIQLFTGNGLVISCANSQGKLVLR